MKILIADDNEGQASNTQSMLAELGYAAMTIPSSEAAVLQTVSRDRYNLVLLRTRLGSAQDGIAFAAFLSHQHGLPVVYIVEPSDEAGIQGFTLLPPFGYITSPFDARDLKMAIEMGLYNHQMQLRFRQNEQALRESERRQRAILDNISDPVWMKDRDGKFLVVNRAWSEAIGIPEDHVIGKRGEEFLPASLAARFEIQDQAVLHSGQAWQQEEQVAAISKSSRWFETHKTPLRDEQGEVIGIVGIARDITTRKLAEQALLHSRDLMRYIIEHNRSAIAVHDRSLKYIYVSRRYLEEYKVKESDVIGRHHYEVFPDLPQKWREVHQKALEGIVSSAEDDPYEREDGSVDWTRWECRPWYEANGSIGGIIVYTEVVTARKRMELALRESQETFASAFHVGPLLMAIRDLESGRYIEVNEKCLDLTGYTRDEIVGRTPEQIGWVTSEIRARQQELLQREGRIRDFEMSLLTKDGRTLYCLYSATMVTIQGRKRLISISQDITERKRAEIDREKLQAQLSQAQKMESVGRLAGGVAHDFNNMLGAILGNVTYALQDLPSDSPLRESLEEIQKCALRSADLTRQLLAFARKQTVAPQVLHLNATVESMLKMLRRLIGEDVELAWIPAPDLWPVKVDPSQIDQILANLCVNSRDAIHGVGKVTLETANVAVDATYAAEHPGFVSGDYVALVVSDNGCGMDKETLAHLFEPFFTTKEAGKGTGLGLATVYGIVRQNGGFINVYSEPAHGSTFRIYLPRHAEKAVKIPPSRPAQSVIPGLETILLVEDEPALLRISRRTLVNLGYNVLAASSPGEAIGLAEKHSGQIQLLITDVVMPEMNGRELATRLLSLFPNLKCLFMSGYTANVIAHHGVLDEGIHFLQKPFTVQTFADKVREAMGVAQ